MYVRCGREELATGVREGRAARIHGRDLEAYERRFGELQQASLGLTEQAGARVADDAGADHRLGRGRLYEFGDKLSSIPEPGLPEVSAIKIRE